MSLRELLVCLSCRNVLDLYVDRRLTAKTLARVDAHLDRCAECRREARVLAPVREAGFPIAAPAGLAESILAQLEAGAEPGPAPAPALRLAPAQAAALVYLGLLAAGHATPGLPSQDPPGRTLTLEGEP